MLREIVEAQKVDYSKPALALIKKLINIKKTKKIGRIQKFQFNMYGRTISNNNGASVLVEKGLPILDIAWYDRCGRDGESHKVITDDMFNSEYTCLEGSKGNSIKTAMEMELEIYKAMPKQLGWEDYEKGGIVEDRGWLSGGGYVSHSVLRVDPKTKLDVVKGYIFHEIHDTVEVLVDKKEVGKFDWFKRMDAVKLISSHLKKGKEVFLNTSSN